MGIASIARRRQLTGLGFVLCLLAVLFAVEAKLAWYGPEAAPATQISSSKLQPADAQRHMADALAAIQSAPSVEIIKTILLFSLVLAAARLLWMPAVVRTRVPQTSTFSPQHFFRPPPSL